MNRSILVQLYDLHCRRTIATLRPSRRSQALRAKLTDQLLALEKTWPDEAAFTLMFVRDELDEADWDDVLAGKAVARRTPTGGFRLVRYGFG